VDGHLKTSGPQVLLFDVHGGLKIMNTKQDKGVLLGDEHKNKFNVLLPVHPAEIPGK
jgi:hypothetical protein